MFENQQRMAGVALKLIAVSVPLAALLLYITLGREGAPAGGGSTAAPPAASGQRPPERSAQPLPSPPAPVELAVVAPSADPTAALPPALEGLVLELLPSGPCWISLTVDGRAAVARVVGAGERVVERVRQEAVLHVGDAGVLAFTINGREGRSLGGRGEVKSVTISPDNYESFLR